MLPFPHSELEVPQAEFKLQNSEGNRNQERHRRNNTPNHGPVREGGGASTERYDTVGPNRLRGENGGRVAALTQPLRFLDHLCVSSALISPLQHLHCRTSLIKTTSLLITGVFGSDF